MENDETNTEALFRTGLTNFLASLNGPAKFDAPDPVTINSSVYFSGTKTLRSLLPQFNGDSYVQNSLPDYSFGGILVNEPAYLVEKQLRRMLPTYAGIYLGHVADFVYGTGDDGFFGVFLGTNQQASVVGYDVASWNHINENQSGGVGAQFPVNPHGDWQFNSNRLAGVAGSGSLSKDGSFDGELDFTNNDSVWLHGSVQSALQNLNADCYQCHSAGDFASRAFQNVAGNYTGTWSMTNQGVHYTGKLQAVLTDAGYLPFCFYDPTGAQNDGGMGQFGSNNKFQTVNATSGDVYSGTLNPTTLQISGTITNTGYRGTFTLTRSATVSFDVPPGITKNLPLTLTANAGTNLVISLVATGSPPMCFQWYSNGIAIPLATTNALVLTNLPFSATATYSVTIDNVAGETNSAQLALTVVPEPILIVQMTGRGTISPNYSNALLQIGTTYTMTAAAVTNSGFRFTNWTGGTSLPLAVLTNGATLKFTMVSNLVLQANFVDTNRPTLTIAAPTAGQHMTNALAFVTGTAADNWKVTGVWCQLNSNAWTLATSTNGWTNWTTLFKLTAGTNPIRAYAADLGGNFSLTNSVSVLSSNAFKLLLNLTNGQPLPGNGLTFNLQLSPGLNGHIQVSTNLADWTVLTNFVGTNAAATFRDPAATNGTRFYRAVVP